MDDADDADDHGLYVSVKSAYSASFVCYSRNFSFTLYPYLIPNHYEYTLTIFPSPIFLLPCVCEDTEGGPACSMV